MEKVIYRNKQNGKIGTLVQKNDKFRQYVLEVDGKNIPYSSSTIKRWWEVIDAKDVEAQVKESESAKTDNTEKEVTSVSESEQLAAKTKEEIVNVTVDPKPANEQKTKKVSNTSKVSGPDMEVFSRIKEMAKEAGFSLINRAESKSYGNGKWILLGDVKNNRIVCVAQIYLAKNHIKVLISDKKADQLDAEVLSKLSVTKRNNINLNLSYTVNYSEYEKFVPEFLKIKN